MKWRFLLYRLKRTAYGLTHWKCKGCQYPKGLTMHRFCYACQHVNLMRGLFDSEEEFSPNLDKEGE